MEREVSEVDRKLFLRKSYLDKIHYYINRNPISQDELYTVVRKFFGEYLKLDYEFTYEELSQELNKVFIAPKIKEHIDDFLIRLSESEYLEETTLGTTEINGYLEELNEIIRTIIYDDHPVKVEETIIQKVLKRHKEPSKVMDVASISALIDEVNFHITNGNLDIAKNSYVGLLKAYDGLSKEDKKRLHDDLNEVYERLQTLIKNPKSKIPALLKRTTDKQVIETKASGEQTEITDDLSKARRLIDETTSYITASDVESAKKSYTGTLRAYEVLSPEDKEVLHSRLNRLYTQLHEMLLKLKSSEPVSESFAAESMFMSDDVTENTIDIQTTSSNNELLTASSVATDNNILSAGVVPLDLTTASNNYENTPSVAVANMLMPNVATDSSFNTIPTDTTNNKDNKNNSATSSRTNAVSTALPTAISTVLPTAIPTALPTAVSTTVANVVTEDFSAAIPDSRDVQDSQIDKKLFTDNTEYDMYGVPLKKTKSDATNTGTAGPNGNVLFGVNAAVSQSKSSENIKVSTSISAPVTSTNVSSGHSSLLPKLPELSLSSADSHKDIQQKTNIKLDAIKTGADTSKVTVTTPDTKKSIALDIDEIRKSLNSINPTAPIVSPNINTSRQVSHPTSRPVSQPLSQSISQQASRPVIHPAVDKLDRLLKNIDDDIISEKFDRAKYLYKDALLFYRSMTNENKAICYEHFYGTFKRLDDALHQKSLSDILDKHLSNSAESHRPLSSISDEHKSKTFTESKTESKNNSSTKLSDKPVIISNNRLSNNAETKGTPSPESLKILKTTTLPVMLANDQETTRVYELIEESYFNIDNQHSDLAMLKYFKALESYHKLPLYDKKKLYSSLYDLFKKLSVAKKV